MTLAAIAGTSFVLSLSRVVMPGSLPAVTITESMHRSLRAGRLLVAGPAVLEGGAFFASFTTFPILCGMLLCRER